MLRLNWFNYLFLPIDGYGRFGLKCVQALLRMGVNVRPDTIDALDRPSWFQRAQGIDFTALSICLMPPNHLRPIPGRVVNYTMYEATLLPEGWAEAANKYAQWLMVPSRFLVDVFRNAGVTVPIEVVQGGIDPEECPVFTQTTTPDRPFRFMCLGDRGSRKGMDTAYMAFYRAFGQSKDVRLIIKCRPDSLPFVNMSNSDNRVSIWRSDVEQVSDIYAQADCYVFPTRGEGYGMPCREAAACGVPTIATRWSGTADDLDCWGIPIERFTLQKSIMDGGGDWATPDIDEVADRMRWVYDHREEAKAKALTAAQWLRDNQTWAHTAQRLIEVVGAYQ